MRELREVFNAATGIEDMRLFEDMGRVEEKRRAPIDKLFATYEAEKERIEQQRQEERSCREQAEALRLLRQSDENNKALVPPGFSTLPMRTQEQQFEAAERFREQAAFNIQKADQQQDMARDEAFRKQLRETVDKALKPETRAERLIREFSEASRNRDDFGREI